MYQNVFNAKVIAIDVNDKQLALAKEMGADPILNPKTDNVDEIIQKDLGSAQCSGRYRGKSAFARRSAVSVPQGDVNGGRSAGGKP